MVKQGVLAANPWEEASGLDPEAVHHDVTTGFLLTEHRETNQARIEHEYKDQHEKRLSSMLHEILWALYDANNVVNTTAIPTDRLNSPMTLAEVAYSVGRTAKNTDTMPETIGTKRSPEQ